MERGVLRNCGEMASHFVLWQGVDFEPLVPSSPAGYLASGLAMFYQRAEEGFNAELRLVPCVQPGALEFEIVALKDIPAGTPLLRRVQRLSSLQMAPPDVDYSRTYSLSDEELDNYLQDRRQLDLEIARNARSDPEELHEEAIREHVRQTREGILDPIGSPGDVPASVVLPHPSWPGYGVFAQRSIRAGEPVEWGLQRKVNLDGHSCPYVFTWNPNGRRKQSGNVWTTGSGNSMFYNSDVPANIRFYRLFSGFRYLAVAKRDILAGEELVHLYASSSWRSCFVNDFALPKLLPLETEAA